MTRSSPLTVLSIIFGAALALRSAEPATIEIEVAGIALRAIATADFDEDGRPDLAANGAGTVAIAVFLARGEGQFERAPDASGLRDAYLLRTGDADGDGHVDLATGGPFGVTVAWGRGDGSFEDPRGIPFADSPRDLRIVDVDGDGIDDLLIAQENRGSLAFRRGRPHREFESVESIPLPIRAPHIAMAVDLDADGDAELVAWGRDEEVHLAVYERSGDGAWIETVLRERFLEPGIVAPTGFVGDFDGDGVDDALLGLSARSQIELTIISGSDDDAFAATRLGTFAGDAAIVAQLGDDLHDDIAIVSDARPDDAHLTLRFLSSPAGDIGITERCTRRVPSARTESGLLAAVPGDFDGDGELDMAFARDGRIQIATAPHDGCVPTPRCLAPGVFAAARGERVVGAGDIDGAPGDEVVTIEPAVGHIHAVADGAIVATETFPAPVLAPAGVVADWNRDGHDDLALADFAEGRVAILLREAGAFRSARPVDVGLLPNSLAAGDFDEDGIMDFAVGFAGEPRVAVLGGSGDGSFSPLGEVPTDDAIEVLATGDVDGDGHIDLVATSSTSPEIRLALGTGDGRFGPPTRERVPADSRTIRVADVDGNGIDDVAVGSGSLRTVTLRLGLGRDRRPGLRILTVPNATALHDVALLDIGGDAHLDVVAIADGPRQLAIWVTAADGTLPRDPTQVALLPGPLGLDAELDATTFAPDPGGAMDLAVLDRSLGTISWHHVLGCGREEFIRADVDGDGVLALNDAVLVLGALFQGRGPVACEDAADANDDGRIDLTDPITALSYLFLGGPRPPAPFPDRGTDPTGDGLSCGAR